MKEILLTTLRSRATSRKEFRHAATALSYMLAAEAAALVPTESVTVQTPWAPTQGAQVKGNVVLVIILRAGFALLPGFLSLFPGAAVGFIGLRRDEKTAQAKQYYLNIPEVAAGDTVIVLDPTLATGGSASAALAILTERGIEQKRIIFVGVLCAQEGMKKVAQTYSVVRYLFVAQDAQLNDRKFIVPGFGDFGDRYFGTE